METITFGTATLVGLSGYAVVFFGLILLMLVVMVMGKIMESRKQATPATAEAVEKGEAPAAAPAPGSAGELKLYDTPERDAAMVMAIVADRMGRPLNELRFKSIKEVKKDEV